MSTTEPQRRKGGRTQSTTTATASSEPTVETWRVYRRRGGRRVQFIGLFGNATGIYGSIRRVTTANIFVLVDGADTPEPFHPASLRPTNVWPKATA